MNDGLYLESGSLLSKWGFHDGDIPDEVYDILFDELGYQGHGKGPQFEWQPVLLSLIRDYLLPALDQRIELENWSLPAVHNPARAASIDGAPVPDGVHRGEVEWPVTLTPAGVTVPWNVVRERCAQAMNAPV